MKRGWFSEIGAHETAATKLENACKQLEQTQVLLDAAQAAHNIAADHETVAHALALAATGNLLDQFERDVMAACWKGAERVSNGWCKGV